MLAVALTPGVVVAQQPIGPADPSANAPAASPATARIDQVASPSRQILRGDRAYDPVQPMPVQVLEPAQRQGVTAQLSSERPGAQVARQLSRGGTADAPPPLSQPQEGRTGATARVEGRDRCDPAVSDPASVPLCAQVIETRASEFRIPDPLILSPEQKLLVDQRLREAPATRAAIRQGDASALDPDAAENQAIAAVALGGPAAQEREAPGAAPTIAELPEASAALLEALLRNAGTQIPQ
jgi:hypothetical protein